MRGVLATMSRVKYIDVNAKIKAVIAKKFFTWTYVKCSSRKRYSAALASSPALAACASEWTCYLCSITPNDYKLTRFESPLYQKKYDDFLDTLLLLKFPQLSRK